MYKHVLAAIAAFVLLTPLVNSTELLDALKSQAAKEDAEAYYHLGMLYNNGLDVVQSPATALEYFTKASQLGDPLGDYKLGCYYAGQFGAVDGITEDSEKAFSLKHRAAKAGYSLAQYDVAGSYFRRKDLEKSRHWAERAAQQGYTKAFRILMYFYQQPGYPGNQALASYKALLKAKKTTHSDTGIDKALAGVESELTESQIAQARQQVQTWTPTPSPLTQKAMAGLHRARVVAGLKQE